MQVVDENISSYKSKKPVYIVAILILILILVSSILVAVTIGSSNISPVDVYKIILYKLFGIGSESLTTNNAIHDVVWHIRLPRLVLGATVGMGLATSGVIMQSIVKNPLADPYILGISSGASLGATISIMFGLGGVLGSNAIGVGAFIGALLISLLVLLVASVGGRSNSMKLLLSGMAISSMCSAFSSFVVYISNDKDALAELSFWQMGSLAGATWEQIIVILPIVILGVIFFITQSRILNLMLLGDEVSVTLGTDLNKYRQLYIVVASLIIGFVVYSSGMIGFIGLIIPHVVRIFVGTDHKKVIPISALVGGIFLVWADVLCRVVISGTEVPIGILTAMLGAPCFIILMTKKAYGFGGSKQ